MKNLTKFRNLLVLVAAFAGLANAGCSTPEVQDVSTDQPSTAWWAYQDCMGSLPANTASSQCDNVGTVASMPKYNYTGSTSTGTTATGRGPYTKTGESAAMTANLDNSYRDYLNSLDAKTQNELAAKFKALVDASK